MAYDNTNKGTLSRNDRKTTDRHPDFKGKINVDGKEFWLSGWTKEGPTGSFISLAVQPKEDAPRAGNPDDFLPAAGTGRASSTRPAGRTQSPQSGFEDMDDDIPF